MEKSRLVPVYLNEPNPKPQGMVHFLCENITTACRFEPPPVPKVLFYRAFGTQFHDIRYLNEHVFDGLQFCLTFPVNPLA